MIVALDGWRRTNERLCPRPEKVWLPVLALACTLLTIAPGRGQGLNRGAGGAQAGSPPVQAPARLPGTSEEIDRALTRIETALEEVRRRADAAVPEATADEQAERQRLLQQWTVALDSKYRSLRRLKEARAIHQDRAAEAQAWRGHAGTPPYPLALVEGLRDAMASQQLEAETTRMILSIAESGVRRSAALLEESRKQARLARDQVESAARPSQRLQWLLQLAELRVQSNEAMVEASEKGRLVTLELLAGLRQHLGFLERKLDAARAQARFSREDFDSMLTQSRDKREALRRELGEAIASDVERRRALAATRENLRLAQRESAGATAARLKDLLATVEADQARAETSETKVEILQNLLVLQDAIQTVWEDRYWATGRRTLTELRNKRKSYQDSLEGLRPWKAFVELKLSAAASQALSESIKASATDLTSEERASSMRIQAALEERATLYQRASSAIMQAEDAGQRAIADLAEREAGLSLAGRARFVFDGIGSFLRSVWNRELYIAEDSVIADGQKVSVPRVVTVGKVAVALLIFLAGAVVARWGHGAVRQAASRRFSAGEHSAGLAATFVSGVVLLAALVVAMTSVRIPWTVFAFLGGALAIGVGFGAQALINNFISGVILIFERSIRVGDIVQVGDQRGKVRRVGFRNSLIKRGDGIDVLVPNSRFLETEVVNWTLTDDLVRYKISAGVAYGSSPQTVSALIAQAATQHPAVLQTPPPQVLFEDFGENALVFTLVFWIKLQPGTDGGLVRSELRYRIHALFEKAGIVLAFPQREVHLDSARPLEVRLVPSEFEPHPSTGAAPPPPPPGAECSAKTASGGLPN